MTEKQIIYYEFLTGKNHKTLAKVHKKTLTEVFQIIAEGNRNRNYLYVPNGKYKVIYPVHTGSASMHYKTEIVDSVKHEYLVRKYGKRMETIQ